MSPKLEAAVRRLEASAPPRRDRSRWYKADVERGTYTVAEAAKLLGIGRRQAYEATQTGGIPVIRVGRRVLVPKAALHAMLGLAPEAAPVESGGHRTATDDSPALSGRIPARQPAGGHGDSEGGT